MATGIDRNAVPVSHQDNQWICEAFQPITFSHEDDGNTVVQIIEHNAAWEALCGES